MSLTNRSLFEVVEFEASTLLRILDDLRLCEQQARERSASLPFGNRPSQTKGDMELYSRTLLVVHTEAIALGFDQVATQAFRLSAFISIGPLQDIGPRFAVLRQSFEDVLRKQLLLYVDPKKSEYWNQEALFGKEVHSAFGNADVDIREAGNCFVTESYTACVFYLMRVAERGLRALATDLGAPLDHDVVLEEWKTILDAIDRKLKELRSNFRDEAREQEIYFYSEAANQFRFFKDAYRNYVAHARDPYDENTALSILQRVREFMKDLATRLRDAD